MEAARVVRSVLSAQYSALSFDSKLFGWCFNGLPLVDKWGRFWITKIT